METVKIYRPGEISRQTGQYCVVDIEGNPVIDQKGLTHTITISNSISFPDNRFSQEFGYRLVCTP